MLSGDTIILKSRSSLNSSPNGRDPTRIASTYKDSLKSNRSSIHKSAQYLSQSVQNLKRESGKLAHW